MVEYQPKEVSTEAAEESLELLAWSVQVHEMRYCLKLNQSMDCAG